MFFCTRPLGPFFYPLSHRPPSIQYSVGLRAVMELPSIYHTGASAVCPRPFFPSLIPTARVGLSPVTMPFPPCQSANQLLAVLLDLIPYSPHNNTLSDAQNLTTPFGDDPSQNSRQRPRVAPYSPRVTVPMLLMLRQEQYQHYFAAVSQRRRGRSVGYWAPSPWYYMRLWLYPPHPFTPSPTDAWENGREWWWQSSTNSINAPHA
ncbi:hypothetical protein DdX_05421 [Ditylenchus destructor]|uniref:Uncharacterized protein n=1 Tax=Ditylenchus destructor TaxID=166010 RepID=A0AAD4N9N2_9BILA|nr:hypothetical protein DdX_05421 [Ditylenchus destructor]